MDTKRGRDKNGAPAPPPVTRSAMLLLAAAVFVGWLTMWVMLPTRTFSSTWAPTLASHTNSTYFGKQGTRIVFYVFPILFVSVIACVYLYLLKRSGDSTGVQSQRGVFCTRMAAWRRPVLVRGPLGVVTAMELAFFLMFLVLLVWFYSAFINLDFSNIHVKPGEKMWQAKLDRAALRLGHVGTLCCAFLFFPVARGSSLLQLIGLTSEASIKYHVWLGNLAMVFFTAHGLCYIVFWASTDQIHEMVKWARTKVANVPGELALLSGLVMWVTALPRVRRQMFEVFFYAHHLYALFLVFFALHVGVAFFCSILPGVFLFMVDRYVRFLQSRASVRLISARLLACDAVELNFCKSPCLTHSPMSTLFINVPCVSRLQWHPFTVTSSSSLEPDRLSVVVKRAGSWTEKLYETISSLPPSQPGHLDVSVEGPYSQATPASFLQYDSLAMISGGGGITPFISVVRELVHRSGTAAEAATPSLLLIAVFKTSADLAMLDLIVPASGGFSDISRLELRIEAFVTRESMASVGDVAAAHKVPAKEVLFKPSPSHALIAPVLGHNGWLCLAAVVSSSFVIFLLLVGAVQRLYIYPLDGNSNRVYPWAARTLLNLLFLCLGIAAAVSVAVLMWNKRRRAEEAKQVDNVATPSLPTWFDKPRGGDAEVESSPLHYLEQATTVHFGRRPDLRGMLLEIGGTNVGVMASGPPELLEDVATICSSRSASNLHFAFISFSW